MAPPSWRAAPLLPLLLLLLLAPPAASGASSDGPLSSFFLRFHERMWILTRPELPAPVEAEDPCNKAVELNVVPLEVTDPITGEKVMTRSFNKLLPAPTIRVRPGCTLRVTINNELGPANPDCFVTGQAPGQEPIIGNWTCYLNTTNIHTHGFHVSPNPPSDSIFTRLDPGESNDWVFEIPANHMAGTHWYHPHVHHSTATQAGGGMAGALIVEDPEGSVPSYVAAMEEKLLIFFNLDFELQADIERSGLGDYFWQTESKTNAIVVNGVHQPKVTVTPGKWYRFRMIYSAIELMLQMTNKGTAWCATKLLAKDGVWLNVSPRELHGDLADGFKAIPIQLGPGNRADVAISCVCPFPWLGCYSEFYSLQNCSAEAYEINGSAVQINEFNDGEFGNFEGRITEYTPCDPNSNRRRRGCEGLQPSIHAETWGPLEPPKCGFGMAARDGKVHDGPGLGSNSEDTFTGRHHRRLGHLLSDIYNGTIFSIAVQPQRSPFRRWWHPAWKFSVRRPCYLVDMMGPEVHIPERNKRNVNFYVPTYMVDNTYVPNSSIPGPLAIMYNGTVPGKVNDGTHHPIAMRKFQDPPVPEPYGDDIKVGSAAEWNVGGLAFHPFHLHITPYQIYNITGVQDGWFQPGDWHDVTISTSSNCNPGTNPCPKVDDRDGGPGIMFIRFWTNSFTGQYISHCHLLTHEDEGMMFYFNVSGTEGSIDPQTQKIDPTCYTGHLMDAPGSWGWKWAKSPRAVAVQASFVEAPRRLRQVKSHAIEADESTYLQAGVRLLAARAGAAEVSEEL